MTTMAMMMITRIEGDDDEEEQEEERGGGAGRGGGGAGGAGGGGAGGGGPGGGGGAGGGEEEKEKEEKEKEEEEEEEGEKEGGRRKVKLIKLTIDSWPEELSTHGVYRWNMMRLHVAVINWSNRRWFPTWIIPKKGTFVILIFSGIHSLALDEYTLISVP